MNHLRPALFALVAALSSLAVQAQYPYTWIIQGQVLNCYPGQLVQVTAIGNTQPSFQFNTPVDVNCTFSAVIGTNSQAPSALIKTWCGAEYVYQTDSALFSSPQDTIISAVTLACGMTYFDCAGIMNGTAVQGNPCYYGDPFGSGIWDANCNCVPTSTICNVALNVNQNSPWNVMFTCDTMGAPPFSFQWTLPDGSNSSSSTPSFTFGGPGSYTSCITITSSNGCTSTACDTLVVDGSGTVSMMIYDCNGVLNGNDLPGTACDDGDPFTTGDTWDIYCTCEPDTTICQAVIDLTVLGPWTAEAVSISTGAPPIACLWSTPNGQQPGASNVPMAFNAPGTYVVHLYTVDGNGCQSFASDSLYVDSLGNVSLLPIQFNDCLGIPGGTALPGTPCNDGDTLTVQDTWTTSCQCVGVVVNYYDCLQLVNGPNLPGTPCDDGDPVTIGDSWDANCNCVGSVPQPCNAAFWVLQAYTIDSITNLPVPTPNLLWIWNLSSGGTGAFTFLWNFGDGTSSTDPFPTHVYASGGPYYLCLAIADSAGCTSTYCDSVSVDADGMYTGLMGGGNERQNGFTINVRDPLATGITERPTDLGELALWPNPAQDQLHIALVSDLRGAVTVEVLDMSGRVVHSERHVFGGGRTQFTVPTHDLAPGLHALRISNGKSSITQRFVRTE